MISYIWIDDLKSGLPSLHGGGSHLNACSSKTAENTTITKSSESQTDKSTSLFSWPNIADFISFRIHQFHHGLWTGPFGPIPYRQESIELLKQVGGIQLEGHSGLATIRQELHEEISKKDSLVPPLV